MIVENLTTQIQDALKSGDTLCVSTLRLLSSAIHNEEIAKQRGLTEDEELAIVRRQIKQREEATEAYKKGGREEAAQKEAKEEEILKEFLPAQMLDEEIGNIVNQVISETGASSPGDFGKVMGVVMGKIKGAASGDVVSRIVREKLHG
ncbi:MAG: GatB/YqeY domain-containing protein [Candidatus Blackburnbacteria bacterium]|nr:GatB/YqeY domain-containing protein [Candidatus Blackburnbacteria bacterium]